MATAGLPGARSSWTLTAEWRVTAAVHSPERTARRLTVPRHTRHVMLQRILWRRGLRRNVRSSCLTRSAWRIRRLSWWILSARALHDALPSVHDRNLILAHQLFSGLLIVQTVGLRCTPCVRGIVKVMR